MYKNILDQEDRNFCLIHCFIPTPNTAWNRLDAQLIFPQ